MKTNYLLWILVVLFFSACEDVNKKQEIKDNNKTVFATNVKLKDDNQNRIFYATATTTNQIKTSFKVQGNIKKLDLKIGDEVSKNQLISKLDSKPYELKVSQVRYGLSEAKASLKNAQSNYERVKKLYINQNASTSDIDNAKAKLDASKAKVKNILQELEYAKLQESYTKLYSPIDGYISSKFAQENENVQAGMPIVLISDKLVNEVHVQVPEDFVNKLKKDDEVKVLFNSISKKTYNGKISEISKFSSQNEKLYLVIIKLLNSDEQIKIGMSGEVYFNINENMNSSVYLVPSSSVLSDGDNHFVYVLSKDENLYLIQKQEVKVGELSSAGYEITEGLNSKDLVLKAGMSEVFEGMKVELGNKKELGL